VYHTAVLFITATFTPNKARNYFNHASSSFGNVSYFVYFAHKMSVAFRISGARVSGYGLASHPTYNSYFADEIRRTHKVVQHLQLSKKKKQKKTGNIKIRVKTRETDLS